MKGVDSTASVPNIGVNEWSEQTSGQNSLSNKSLTSNEANDYSQKNKPTVQSASKSGNKCIINMKANDKTIFL